MSIKSLGLLITKEKLYLLEKDLENIVIEKNILVDEKVIDELLVKYDIEVNKEEKENLCDFVMEMNSIIINGYKKEENFNKASPELIADGFNSFTDALIFLNKYHFKDYEIIKLRSEAGEVSKVYNKKDFISDKLKIVNKIIKKIKSHNDLKEIINEELSQIKMDETEPFASVGDDYLNKSELVELFENSSLIYGEENKKKIIELLKIDNEEFQLAIETSRSNPRRLNLEKKLQIISDVVSDLTSFLNIFSNYKKVLDFSVSNTNSLEIEMFLETDIMKSVFVFKQFANKYILFTDNDIRDEMQATFKNECPDSKQNIKSRTMIKEMDLLSIVFPLSEEDKILVLSNII